MSLEAWRHPAAWIPYAIVIALLASTAGIARAQDPKQPPSDDHVTQWWKGTFEVQTMTMDFVVVFRPAEQSGQHTATIDIPVQMAKDLPLVDVALTAIDIRFTIPPPANAVFTLKRSTDGKTATGEFKQHGGTYQVRMERITEDEAKAVGPPRPQTPKPPFPYRQRDVTYENPVDGTKLAGTLTIPAGPGPHPAVILITGSGAQDRDETIFGHKPFFVIADHLTRRGIAVLRVDDRGVGGSSGSVSQSTSKDFANDVLSGIRFLRQQPEIDPQRIGLVGHSEGGVIAPLVASRSKNVACIVLLAGSALPGGQILNLQTGALLRAAGASEDAIERELAAHRALVDCVVRGDDEQVIGEALRKLVTIQLQRQGGPAPTPEKIEEVTKQHLPGLQSPWMVWFLRHDPRDVLEKVKCPVLALIGSLDLQVPAKENLSAIEKALHNAGNPDVTVKELPGLNHLFQEARTGLVAEYGLIEQTIAAVPLDELTSWLRRQFKLDE